MHNDVEKRIEELNNQIAYWTKLLNQSRNTVEKGILSDKIIKAKKEISSLSSSNLVQSVVEDIDVPVIADKEEEIQRGQVVNTCPEFISVMY